MALRQLVSEVPGLRARSAESEVRLLRTIALALGETDDLTAALAVVLRGVCDATGWILGQAWLPSPDGRALVCSPAWYSLSPGLEPFRRASAAHRFAPGQGLPGRAWAARQPVWIRDVGLNPRLPRSPIARQVGLKAGMAIPALAGTDVLAVLEFFQVAQSAEDERLVGLVMAAGAHVGALIRRKQVEEALRASDARYRAVVDSALDGIITMGADGRIRSFNRGAERLFGYRAEETVGQPLTLLMPERFRGAHVEGLRRYVATGGAPILGRPVELAGLRRDGTEVPLELTATAIHDPSGTLFAGILRDISERKRVEAERLALQAIEQEHARRVRELGALQADFTAVVAHELGSPLAAIRGLADILATSRLAAPERAQAVAAIQAEARLLTTLVADVHAAASVEREDFTIQPRAVALGALLAEAIAFARTLPGDHPLATSGEIPDQVWVDPERIGQVLRNLLCNAAKHTPECTPIELRATRAKRSVRIEVIDHGPGIPPDDLARIFEKFGRGREPSGRPVAGLGLGLYVARRLCRAHGTELELRSTPGAGSVFAFELELAPSGTPGKVAQTKTRKAELFAGGDPTSRPS